MSNIEQQTDTAVAPQLNRNLDMASHIAGMPASQARNGVGDDPEIKMPLNGSGW